MKQIICFICCFFTISQHVEGTFVRANKIECHETKHPSLSNCVVNETRDFIWPESHEKTAPAPTSFGVSWYKGKSIDGFEVILLNITWSQKTLHFARDVDGYMLSISLIDSMGGEPKHHVTFRNKTLLLDELDLNSNKVHFVYDSFGWENSEDFIFPGYTYIVKIQALPTYFENTSPNLYQLKFLEIPDCTDEEAHINTTKNCASNDFDDFPEENSLKVLTKNRTTAYSAPNSVTKTVRMNTTNPVIIAVFCVVVFLSFVLTLLIVLKKAKWSKNKFNEIKPKEQLLFFVNNASHGHGGRSPYDEIASRLATLLRDYGRVDVCCNLWVKSQISDNLQWLQKRLPDIDRVVLFLAPTSGPDDLTLSRLEALCWSLSVPIDVKTPLKSRIILVSCDHVIEKTRRPRFQIMKQFKQFFESATGRPARNIPSSDVDELADLVGKAQKLNLMV